ncbi:MAG: hypothetical protein AABZ39_10810 [Spirochaetota bacterium]
MVKSKTNHNPAEGKDPTWGARAANAVIELKQTGFDVARVVSVSRHADNEKKMDLDDFIV